MCTSLLVDAQQRPNIIFIMSDGHACQAISAYGYALNHTMKDYLRCIQSVDDNAGRLMKYLKENGLDKNTIVYLFLCNS